MSGTDTSQDGLGVQLRDRVIDRVFGASLTLAGVLGIGSVDSIVAQLLRDVIGELDAAVQDIRGTAAPAHHLAIVRSSSDPVAPAPAPSSDRRRWLCSFDDGQVFAYATPTGHDFFRATDHTPWAHESGDLLLSARSGAPLARRVGRMFHDIDSDAALYYERAE